VTTAKIKKNAVTGAKIKTGTITGSDVKNGSLGGEELNLASLGTVPSATIAGTTADTMIVNKKASSSASNDTVATAESQATEVPLLSTGPFAIYGKCFHDLDDDIVYGRMYARTSVDGALASFYDGYDYSFRLDSTTPETDRYITDVNEGNDGQDSDFTYDATYLAAPDGSGLMFSTIAQVRNGNPTDASAIFPSEHSCIFTVRGMKFTT
jgi:hypothetical protein